MGKKRVIKYSNPLNRYLCRSKCNFRFGAICSLNQVNKVNLMPIPDSILSKTMNKLRSSRLKVVYFKNANKIIPPVPDLIPIASTKQWLKYEKFPVESFHLNPVLFPAPKRRGRPPKRKLGNEIENKTKKLLAKNVENKIKKSPAKNVEKKIKKSPAKNVQIFPKTKVSTFAKSAMTYPIAGLSRIMKGGLTIEPVQQSAIKTPPAKCYKGAPRYECRRSMAIQPLDFLVGNKVEDLPEDLNYGPLSPRSTLSLDPKTGVRICKAAGSNNSSGRSSYSNLFKTVVLPDGSQITSRQDILEIIPVTRCNDVITEREQEEKLEGSYTSIKTPQAKKN